MNDQQLREIEVQANAVLDSLLRRGGCASQLAVTRSALELITEHRLTKKRCKDLQTALHAAYEEGKPALMVRLTFEDQESGGPEIRLLASCHPSLDDKICGAVAGVLGAVFKGKEREREREYL